MRRSSGRECKNRGGPVSQQVGTTQIPPCSKDVSDEDRPKFYRPSPALATSPCEWKVFERDVLYYSINESFNLYWGKTYNLLNSSHTIVDMLFNYVKSVKCLPHVIILGIANHDIICKLYALRDVKDESHVDHIACLISYISHLKYISSCKSTLAI